jgi:hypothetical protein
MGSQREDGGKTGGVTITVEPINGPEQSGPFCVRMESAMTTDQERSVRKALAAVAPASDFRSLRTDGIIATMAALQCEEQQATEIIDQMKQDGAIKEGFPTEHPTEPKARCIWIQPEDFQSSPLPGVEVVTEEKKL